MANSRPQVPMYYRCKHTPIYDKVKCLVAMLPFHLKIIFDCVIIKKFMMLVVQIVDKSKYCNLLRILVSPYLSEVSKLTSMNDP